MRAAVWPLVVSMGFVACGGGQQSPDATPVAREMLDLALPPERELDVLFVIDNSGAALWSQEQLVAHPEVLFTALAAGGELPDIHIGVVTSDLGTLDVNTGDAACGSSDQGHLQGATSVTGTFISDVLDPVAMVRDTNYTGTLAEAFASIVQVGTGGCGFEQHLEAMKVALENADGFNDGFLRDTAPLAVIVTGDEDDCSAKDPGFYAPESDALGPLDSFRCFEFGVTCDQPDPRALGPRTNCRPNADSPYLHDIQRYVDYLEALRPAGRVTVHGVFGDPEPVEVSTRTSPGTRKMRADLVPSCTFCEGPSDANGCIDPTNNLDTADAGVRLDAFVRGFAERGSTSRWCEDDFSPALDALGATLRESLAGQPCLRGTPTSTPASCTVTTTTYGMNSTSVSACDATASNAPCWRLVADAAGCSATPTHLRLEAVGIADAPGRRVTAHCDVQPM